MNILFVWTSPFKDGGGVGRVTTTLGKEFKKRGHQVYYLSFSEGEEYVEDGVPQYFCPVEGAPNSKNNIDYLKQILIEKEIDIIINQAGVSKPEVLSTIIKVKSDLGLSNGIKIFTVHHNCIEGVLDSFELVVKDNYKDHKLYPIIANSFVLRFLKLRHKKKYKKTIEYIVENSNYWVLLSEKFITELKHYSVNISYDKVIGMPNPVPFKPQDVEHKKENRLVFVGRIDFQQKRTDLLIKLWKTVSHQYPEWEFDIVGDGEALGELKRKSQEANLKRIHFHGYQNPIPYLEKAKFFVMTSAFEGFPMVLVEAQAYGVVPFAFNSFSSIYDIIDDKESGFVISAFDIDSYSEKLTYLMKDEKQRKVVSENARKSVERFYPSKVAAKWESFFND